ncbi:MAG TPA: glycosyltransferase, partial [Roseiflexaceae bacterium]|nr:glycosyltransferase [Roseiflexaceae bacterium]
MPTKLAEIDLSRPIEPIYVEPRYDRLCILASWDGQPLGTVDLICRPALRTFGAEELRAELARAFSWFVWERSVEGSLGAMPPEQSPPISVIVCTRDRLLSLDRCLESLRQLDYPDYEVVVVDNCSRDRAVAEVVARSGFRYVRENRPGLDWARNRGIAETHHDLIAYIDDDALASPGWLRGIARAFANPEIMAVTGLVLPAELETGAQFDFERYGGMNKGFKPYTVRGEQLGERELFWSNRWGVGANMAFRRGLFDAIGAFDVALDVGTPTCGGGDIEFFYRTVARGHTLRYEPSALIRHVHRRDGAAFRRLVYNNGRSFPAYLLTIARNEPHKSAALIRFALRRWMWEWLLRRLLKSVMRGDIWTLRLTLIELWGSCSALKSYRAARAAAPDIAAQ